jgi:putative acetyltransferase
MVFEPAIVPVQGPEAMAVLRTLLQEYWQSFGFTPCFQNFSTEISELPGVYAPPRGRVCLAWIGDQPAGCVALRALGETRAEIKRLYVRPRFRGHHLGSRLIEWLFAEARAIGYSELVADTMPVMRRALALYERLGFERTEPYAAQPTEGAIFLRFLLTAPAQNRNSPQPNSSRQSRQGML